MLRCLLLLFVVAPVSAGPAADGRRLLGQATAKTWGARGGMAGLPPQRITVLNKCAENAQGKWVVYWMSAAQRSDSNPALEYAVRKSNEHALPLVVLFCLTDKYPEAYERHYAFMLEGLAEVGARGESCASEQG